MPTSSGGGDSTIHYAEYLEDAHQNIMNHRGVDSTVNSAVALFNIAIGQNPYNGMDQMNIEPGFFSTGYSIDSFPSLWDMFGKFMAGLDVHDLWADMYEDITNGPEIENMVSAEHAMLNDEIDTTSMPRFLAGMRDINSVQSSTFVIGKAIFEDSIIKSLNKLSATLKMHSLDLVNQGWMKHLDWNTTVINVYNEMFKNYYTIRFEQDSKNIEYRAKWAMWGLNLLDPVRSILGSLNGAAAAKTNAEPNRGSPLGGALAGAAAGAQIAGPESTGIGALFGGILGLGAALI